MTFSAIHVALGLLNLNLVSATWPVYIAMVIYCAAAVLTLRPSPGRLPLGYGIASLCAVVLMNLLVCGVLPLDTWPGYASWQLAATYTLLVIMNIRGRVLLSWVGVICSVIITTLWASGASMGVLGGLMLNVATVGWVLVSTGVGHLLRSNDRKVAQYRADAQAAADWYAADRALHLARTRWLDHVTEIAGGPLSLIADPAHEITDNERQELRLAEAQFRDEIRGRVLATSEVVEAARRARERGITVQLLDDRRQDLAPRVLAAASERVVSILNDARSGTVTARARPQGSKLAVTIFASTPESSEEATFVEFPDQSDGQ
ncbi:hypothetical protein [Arthrobacter sp. D2-10]